VRPPGGQRVQAALGAPGQVTAQIGFGVLAGGSLESGQVGGHCPPQLISERHQMIRWDGRQLGEVHHAQMLRPLRAAAKPANVPGFAEADVWAGRCCWAYASGAACA
jgi:hypothetical protein